MILRTIHCEKKGCDQQFTEQHENQGFPNWGHVGGVIAKDQENRQLTITICPECLKEVTQWLTGQT